ncbi:MAG: aminotransferase class I/II-fold pyridoxal phosphate-dependent enzyme [Polyangiaceae bacterium]
MKQETPPALAFLDEAIARARSDDLLRERLPPAGQGLSFCSNDYLALSHRPSPPDPSGCGASRLVSGERVQHRALEACAAAFVDHAAALTFSSGYAANVGVVSALAGPGDIIVSDALNHASIIDGARLSRAQVVVVPHLSLPAVDAALAAPRTGRAFVLVESYFSMDADSPDLGALRRSCDRYGAALIVDEAHALGVLGPGGRGLCVAAQIRADVVVGTFGKAFGAAGAFAAGCPALVLWLWNRARSFVFSTGLSPSLAAAALAGMSSAQAEPERRDHVLAMAAEFRRRLGARGLHPVGYGPIIPWIIGHPDHALRIAAAARTRGLDVRAIRPPSVPIGTARLRLTVTAAHQSADVAHAASVLADAAACGER